MAEITKNGTTANGVLINGPSLATLHPPTNTTLSGLLAGEAIAQGDFCYVKGSDGKVWRCTGAANTAPAKPMGVAATSASVGEAITLYHSVLMVYGTGLTPAAKYFISGTVAGGLADAASTGGLTAVAWAFDATRIWVMGPNLQ